MISEFEDSLAEGKEAVQSQSYGPEARGGASKSEVIIDDAPIYHPHVIVPDLVLAMTQKAADKYWKEEVQGANSFIQRGKRLVFKVPHYKTGEELAKAVAEAKARKP